MDYIICPNCSKTLTDTYSVCPYCNTSLEKSGVQQQTPNAVTSINKSQLMHLILSAAVFFIGIYKLIIVGAIFSGLFMIFCGIIWFTIAKFIITWKNIKLNL